MVNGTPTPRLFSSALPDFMKLAVCIKTIGCRTNQADSLEIRRRLIPLNVKITDDFSEAQVIIINTCAVTARAERDVRHYLGRARRQSPRALIAVAGCMTEITPAGLWRKYGKVKIFSNAAKKDIGAWVGKIALERGGSGALSPRGAQTLPSQILRPPVKVQEGCSMHCSYCIVPRTRGKERSVAPGEILEKIRYFEEGGAQEIVITGIQLGSWGRDLDPPLAIADLVEMLLEKELTARLRLGSIEPWGVNDRLIKLFAAKGSSLCPHVHIPLQSGSDSTLKRMRRPYGTSRYGKIIADLMNANSDLSIGTDVITGFPGETADEFNTTCDFLSGMPFSYLHAFSFSVRHGTPAAEMDGRVPAGEIRKRVNAIIALGEKKRHRYIGRFLGRKVEAVIEKNLGQKGLSGTSAQFFKVSIPPPHADASLVGTRIEVEPLAVEGGKALAKPV